LTIDVTVNQESGFWGKHLPGVELVTMVNNNVYKPVLDELCLSLLFNLLYSLDGLHCRVDSNAAEANRSVCGMDTNSSDEVRTVYLVSVRLTAL